MQKKISKVVKDLLSKRGIKDEDIEEFISKKPKLTYDPFLMNNMKIGAERIIRALNEKETICVYGDYDADGVTSMALMITYLSHFDPNVRYYIPSRFSEGYGLNKEALAELKKSGIDLVITVDCGSVSYDEVEYGKKIGLDFVITDHHDISDVVADAIVISPKYIGSTYPFDGLAGCGVAFKLIQALQRLQNAPKEYLTQVLEFIAIGTVGDIMPMLDENRTLVKYGLKKINSDPSAGIKKLMELTCKEDEQVKAIDLSFKIVPYINAAGRMGRADVAVNLLLEKNEEKAEQLAQALFENNEKRREVQDESFRRCENMIAKMDEDLPILLIQCDEVHEGIAGIVAGKLKDKHSKTVILVTRSEDGLLKGTSRSFGGLHLHEFLDNFSDMFERFGGHSGACGFSIKQERFEEFSEEIMKKANEMRKLNPEIFEESDTADMELTLDEISEELVDELRELEPFGRCFEKPLFAFKAENLESPMRIGNAKNHIRFLGVDELGRQLQCIKFNAAEEEMQDIERGKATVVVGYSEINEWKGNRTVQFRVSQLLPIM